MLYIHIPYTNKCSFIKLNIQPTHSSIMFYTSQYDQQQILNEVRRKIFNGLYCQDLIDENSFKEFSHRIEYL